MMLSDYENLGWSVFPLQGKRPIFLKDKKRPWGWKEDGCTYEPFNYRDATGIGVICKASRLIVIDVDTSRGDGHADLAEIERMHGIDLKEAAKAVVRTGRDGLHLYYDAPNDFGKIKGDLTKNIDIRYDAYVVAPPSMHPDTGVIYEWKKEPTEKICPLPSAILEMIKKPSVSPQPTLKPFVSEEKSIIEKIRAQESVPSLLAEAGYKQVGNRWLAPRSSSGMAGVTIFDDGRVRSKHGEASCDIAAAQGDHSLDVVDLVRVLRYGGSQEAMLDAYRPKIIWDDSLLTDTAPKTPKKSIKKSELENLAEGIEPWDLPGKAKEVYSWIDSQSIYSRQTLAAGAALWVISSAGGLRYFDELDDLGLNMLIFAVSGSATGKEAIMQASTRLMADIGIARALHGKIKSEQEMYRNIIDHQGAFYLVDEIGIFMRKLSSASKSGGAPYLEGVIGAIMEMSTKSRGMLAITGDMKRDLIAGIEKRIALLQKKLDEGRGSEGEIESLRERIQDAEDGIKEPFLTLYGATTPTTFDDILTPENAQNGLLGRTLILREYEDNPRRKSHRERVAPPTDMLKWLRNLYWGNSFEIGVNRVETQGERAPIFTMPDAAAMLDEVYNDFWAIAEKHKEGTGLAAIPRRGWEMASKISLILAMADGGARTTEHVLYGYAMARKDVSTKLRYAFAASEAKSAGEDTQRAMARAAILSGLSKDAGRVLWQIERDACFRAARVYAPDRENLLALLASMADAGEVRIEETGKTSKYYLT